MGRVVTVALIAILSQGCAIDSSLQCGDACAHPASDAGSDQASAPVDSGSDAIAPGDDGPGVVDTGGDTVAPPDTGSDGPACLPLNSPCNETGGTPCCSGDCSGSSGTHTCK